MIGSVAKLDAIHLRARQRLVRRLLSPLIQEKQTVFVTFVHQDGGVVGSLALGVAALECVRNRAFRLTGRALVITQHDDAVFLALSLVVLIGHRVRADLLVRELVR